MDKKTTTPTTPSLFTRFAKATSTFTGRPSTFIIAVLIILTWAFTGPLFKFSDTWQLVINTGTTIITFLMVFLIQNTQNRDSMAMQLKLDELIVAIKEANNEMVDIENKDEKELEEKRESMLELAQKAQEAAADIEEAQDNLEDAKAERAEAAS